MDIKELWTRKKSFLQARYTYVDRQNRQRPWILAYNEHGAGPLKLGCVVCLKMYGVAEACKSKTLAAFPEATKETMRTTKLDRHSKQKIHLNALQYLAARAGGQPHVPLVPDLKEFQDQWVSVRKGNRDEKFPQKSRKLIFCLAEAVRHFQREQLRDAKCISISQDGSNTRQLIRYATCSSTFEATTGVLGSLGKL